MSQCILHKEKTEQKIFQRITEGAFSNYFFDVEVQFQRRN